MERNIISLGKKGFTPSGKVIAWVSVILIIVLVTVILIKTDLPGLFGLLPDLGLEIDRGGKISVPGEDIECNFLVGIVENKENGKVKVCHGAECASFIETGLYVSQQNIVLDSPGFDEDFGYVAEGNIRIEDGLLISQGVVEAPTLRRLDDAKIVTLSDGTLGICRDKEMISIIKGNKLDLDDLPSGLKFANAEGDPVVLRDKYNFSVYVDKESNRVIRILDSGTTSAGRKEEVSIDVEK